MPSVTSTQNEETTHGDGMATRRPRKKKGRLDYCLITPDLTEQLINVQHQYTTSTDHASIIIEIGTEVQEYGKGTFRAPPNIQNDPIYAKLARQCIRDTLLDCKMPSNVSSQFKANMQTIRISQANFTKKELSRSAQEEMKML